MIKLGVLYNGDWLYLTPEEAERLYVTLDHALHDGIKPPPVPVPTTEQYAPGPNLLELAGLPDPAAATEETSLTLKIHGSKRGKKDKKRR